MSKSPAFSSKSKRTCRNILVYGSCKYEHLGCEFNHSQPETTPATDELPDTSKPPHSIAALPHSLVPQMAYSTAVKPKLQTVVGAPHPPAFYPAGDLLHESHLNHRDNNSDGQNSMGQPRSFVPTFEMNNLRLNAQSDEYPPYNQMQNPSNPYSQVYDPTAQDYQNTSQYPPPNNPYNPYSHAGYLFGNTAPESNWIFEKSDTTNQMIYYGGDDPNSDGNIIDYNGGAPQQTQQYLTNKAQLDEYFARNRRYASPQPTHAVTRKELQYHLYTSPAPHVSNIQPHYFSIHKFFIDDNHRELLHRQNEARLQVTDNSNIKLPSQVHTYHSLYPIEHSPADGNIRISNVFGYSTKVYKATRSVDGKAYIMRRIENYLLGNEASISCIEAWRRIRHSGIVSVCEGFTTKAFGDTSLILIYEYHPLSVSLTEKYFARKDGGASYGINEQTLWSYICQLTSAIQATHSANLSVRVLEPSKILITSINRLRINCVGILDMLTFDSSKTLHHLQQDDLWSFGQLILALACGSLAALQSFQTSIEYVSRNYSPELKNVLMYLLSSPTNFKSIDDVISMIAPKLVFELNTSLHANDRLEDVLSAELENGRLVRLMSKLGFINERPEFELDTTWAETGDRYLLKLFRDYVFHQVSEHGEPVIDMSHVISCLNKLDVGTDEKIMLTSRDEQSCLIVSYRDLKKCIDTTFRELCKRRGKIVAY